MMSKITKNNLSLSLSITLVIALIITGALTACSSRDDHEHPDLKSGEALFNHHCAECHGEDGTGKLVSQTPANILTKRGRDGIVKYVTTNINPQREMPVFSTMSFTEAAAIATHLIKLQQTYEATPNNMKKPQVLMIEP